MISYYIKLVCFIFYYCYIYIILYCRCIILHDIIWIYMILYYVISYHIIIAYHIIVFHIILCYIILCYVILWYRLSYYVLLYHIILHINQYTPFFLGMYHICIRERLFSRSLSFRHCCKMDRWIQPENMRLTWTIVSSQPKWTQTTLCWTLLG